jgi:hypothetical protein
VGIGGGVDNQTLETASDCPLLVVLVVEDCLEMKAKTLALNRSYLIVREEAQQTRLGQRSSGSKLAEAERGVLVEVVEEVQDLDMGPLQHDARVGGSGEVVEVGRQGLAPRQGQDLDKVSSAQLVEVTGHEAEVVFVQDHDLALVDRMDLLDEEGD